MHGVVVDLVALGVALLVGAFFHFTVGALVRRALHALVRSSRFTWDDALAESRVLHRLVHLIPLAVVHACQRFIQLTPIVDTVVDRIVNVLLVFVFARAPPTNPSWRPASRTRSEPRPEPSRVPRCCRSRTRGTSRRS